MKETTNILDGNFDVLLILFNKFVKMKWGGSVL